MSFSIWSYSPHDPGHQHHGGLVEGVEKANEFLPLVSELLQRHTKHHGKHNQAQDVHAISFGTNGHLKHTTESDHHLSSSILEMESHRWFVRHPLLQTWHAWWVRRSGGGRGIQWTGWWLTNKDRNKSWAQSPSIVMSSPTAPPPSSPGKGEGAGGGLSTMTHNRQIPWPKANTQILQMFPYTGSVEAHNGL